jgi:hypothetical protein
MIRIEIAGRSGNADRRRRDDALEIWILLNQLLSHVITGRIIVVAIDDGIHLHVLYRKAGDVRSLCRRLGTVSHSILHKGTQVRSALCARGQQFRHEGAEDTLTRAACQRVLWALLGERSS